MIDHIDIIKGPFSALYGGFALGGVVNIVTKKTAPDSSVSFMGGSYGAEDGTVVLTHQRII